MTAADRERLILSLGAQVVGLVNRIYRSISSTVEREDMISEAWIGAILAVDSFDPARGVKLATFAERRIRGRILDYLREMDPVTRKHRREIREGKATAPMILPLLDFSSLDDKRALTVIAQIETGCDVRGLCERSDLNTRQRLVLKRKYWDSSTDLDVAEDLGVSQSRVSQLHKRAIEQLRAV